MPIPSPRKGQTREAFISQCMHAIGDEYDDKKQALAICFGKWSDKKAKASYAIGVGDNERLYIKSSVLLPESLIAKLATLPESGPGYHMIKVTFKDGATFCGVAKAGEFETEGDEIDEYDPREIVDVVLND